METRDKAKALREYIDELKKNGIDAVIPENIDLSLTVSDIVCDSRTVRKGAIMVCKGEGFCEEYAEEAIRRGAACLIRGADGNGERETNDKYTAEAPNDTVILHKNGADAKKTVQEALALLSSFHYGHPMKKLITVAVTSTKGKTTAVNQICKILSFAPNAHVSTLAAITEQSAKSDSRPFSHLTTPESCDIHRAAAEFLRDGGTHLICEISSQAQASLRTYGITFDIACFINFGNDHISPKEHSDIDDYFRAKASLFTQCRTAVLNIGNPYGSRIMRELPNGVKLVTFAMELSADHMGRILPSADNGIRLYVSSKKTFSENYRIEETFSNTNRPSSLLLHIPLSGAFNAENALCATAAAKELGATEDMILKGIYHARPEGRMEHFSSIDGRVKAIVDYAHNLTSFRALFRYVRNAYEGYRITAVFGCPGGKAFNRRKELAETAAYYADNIVICEEDSSKEDFGSISREITSFLGDLPHLYVCEDRECAIRNTMRRKLTDDTPEIFVVTGKGVERFLERKYGYESYIGDDEAVKSCIAEYDHTVNTQRIIRELQNTAIGSICLGVRAATDVQEQIFIDNIAVTAQYYMCGGGKLAVICRKKRVKRLKNACFSQGVTIAEFDCSADAPSKKKKLADAVRSAQKRGALPILSVSNEKDELDALNVLSTHKPVFFCPPEAFDGKNGKSDLAGRIDLTTANRLVGKTDCEYTVPSRTSSHIALAEQIISGGTESVLFINAVHPLALAAYCLGGRYTALELTK